MMDGDRARIAKWSCEIVYTFGGGGSGGVVYFILFDQRDIVAENSNLLGDIILVQAKVFVSQSISLALLARFVFSWQCLTSIHG